MRSDETAASPVLGWFSQSDFAHARLSDPRFSSCAHYSEFEIERDAHLLSLGAAGLSVHVQHVRFIAFQKWTRLTGAPFDIGGLDDFAAHFAWRARRPDAPTRGWLGDPAQPRPGAVEVAGVQWIVFTPEAFLRWRGKLPKGETFAAARLDGYAAQIVEDCLAFMPRAPRAAAHSA